MTKTFNVSYFDISNNNEVTKMFEIHTNQINHMENTE